MNTKKYDVKYCGVSYEKVRDAMPVVNWENMKHFHHYLIERYNIHKKKDVEKLPKPWTDDPILKNYKFTNVRREHDRQSVYLINNIVKNDSLSLEDKIYNILLFRFWNNWESMSLLGGPWKMSGGVDDNTLVNIHIRYRRALDDYPDRLWFSSAYNQGGTKSAWKTTRDENNIKIDDIPMRAFYMIKYAIKNGIAARMIESIDQQECFEIIKEIPGYSDFLAYQVFVDCTYIEKFPYSENEFVIAGPGCKNGLDQLFTKPDELTYEELLFYFRDSFDELFCVIETSIEEKYKPIELFDDLPLEDRVMNIMSLENCMCEFSKYIRTVNGTGRPKNTYQGGK